VFFHFGLQLDMQEDMSPIGEPNLPDQIGLTAFGW